MEKTSATSGNSKEKEYENNEPPQVEDDHQWLLTGPEYSSDEAGDGTVIDPDPQWLQMGPEFSSDISADGPQQDGVSENLPIGSVPPSSGQRIVPVNPRVLHSLAVCSPTTPAFGVPGVPANLYVIAVALT